MKTFVALAMVAMTPFAFSQQENTLPPHGYVGLGTLTPDVRLQVHGNVKIDSCIVVSDTAVFESDAKIAKDLKVSGQISASNLVSTQTFDDKDFLFIDNQGFIRKGTKDNAIKYLADQIYSLGCDPLQTVLQAPVWRNGPNKIFSPCSPVKVGIATVDPLVSLDVRGQSSSLRHSIGFGDFIDPITMVGRLHVREPISSLSNSSAPIVVIENVQRQLLRLDNTGLLKTREIIVDAEDWADFVFEEDYVLMPLSEVESYINQHGHLPNVPSAAEVEEEGQNLGEMNQILLQKIEELTLHLIEQQKQIDELKEQINND